MKGIDISKYAIENSVNEVKNDLCVGNANNLPFEDNYFDLVISITTIHNLDNKDLTNSLKEIMRVSKKDAGDGLDITTHGERGYHL